MTVSTREIVLLSFYQGGTFIQSGCLEFTLRKQIHLYGVCCAHAC